MDHSESLRVPGPTPEEVLDLISHVRADLASVTREKHRVEELALHYQTKLASYEKKCAEQHTDGPSQDGNEESNQRPTKRRRSSQSQTELIARTQAELDASKIRVNSLSVEKRSLEEKMVERDRVIAADAKELDSLRQENALVHDLKLRLQATEAELKAAEVRSQRHTMESQVRLSMGEESTKFLNAEIIRLSEELTKARFAADTTTASHATAIRASNERSRLLSEQVAEAKAQNHGLEDHLRKMETDSSTFQSTAERDKLDYEKEMAGLKRIVEIQKDLTKEAEQRVLDYEEIVQSLKEEIRAQEKESTPKGKLGAHAEVLLKNLQDALNSRMRLLHQQKEEMERARASEMALLAREETLLREAEDARWETEQAKKEMARMKLQMKDQARKVVHLEKQVEMTESDQQHESMMRLEDGPRDTTLSAEFRGAEKGRLTDLAARQPSTTPDSLQEVDAAVQELTSIRRRHQKLLMNMRERRAAYS